MSQFFTHSSLRYWYCGHPGKVSPQDLIMYSCSGKTLMEGDRNGAWGCRVEPSLVLVSCPVFMPLWHFIQWKVVFICAVKRSMVNRWLSPRYFSHDIDRETVTSFIRVIQCLMNLEQCSSLHAAGLWTRGSNTTELATCVSPGGQCKQPCSWQAVHAFLWRTGLWKDCSAFSTVRCLQMEVKLLFVQRISILCCLSFIRAFMLLPLLLPEPLQS